MQSRRLRRISLFVITMGALVLGAKPKVARAADPECGFCGSFSMCASVYCDLECGGVGPGAGCYGPGNDHCFDENEYWVQCWGDVS